MQIGFDTSIRFVHKIVRRADLLFGSLTIYISSMIIRKDGTFAKEDLFWIAEIRCQNAVFFFKSKRELLRINSYF